MSSGPGYNPYTRPIRYDLPRAANLSRGLSVNPRMSVIDNLNPVSRRLLQASVSPEANQERARCSGRRRLGT
ncbi:hypothetical protein CEP54_010288 [Fusarium duplospermum]|uniref:Uncharacterized protein n=1 Tax=Fusarium duplospermum TaxID=1325734 RepID=A0A428PKY5_9HYPO|nr:hypothetical protein CEP54_010288 [Fusarium duplospermum]